MARNNHACPDKVGTLPALGSGNSKYSVNNWRHTWFNGTDLSRNELLHSSARESFSPNSDSMDDMLQFYPRHETLVSEVSQQLDLKIGTVALTPGSDAALRAICLYYAKATGGRGTVLLQDPNYPAVEQTATKLGLHLDRIRIRPDQLEDHESELISAASTCRNAMIYVSVPNGPLGGALSAAQLDTLADISADQNHLLVIDSCYQAFNGDLRDHLQKSRRNTIVVQSLSKSHGLAGARVAILRCESALLDQLDVGHLEHAVSTFSLANAAGRLRQTSTFEAIWSEISSERSYAHDLLAASGLNPIPSGGNFLSVATPTRTTAKRLHDELLCSGYKVKLFSEVAGLENFIRFTIAERELNRSFLGHLRAAVSKI